MEIDDKKEEKENEKNILRVIIVGDEDTGKTEYLDRVRNVDNRKLSSNEVEMRFRKMVIDDKTYFIEIIKIPGKDKHLHYPNIKSLAAQVFGSFCFCSATDHQTKENAIEWKKVLHDSNSLFRTELPCVLIENKIDLLPSEEQMNDVQLKQFAKENSFSAAFRVSVKEGINVEESFDFLIKEAIAKRKELYANYDVTELDDHSLKVKKKSKDEKKKFKYDLKIVLVGQFVSGKTSFSLRWMKDQFNAEYKATIVSECEFKIYEYNGDLFRIQLWDCGMDKNYTIMNILLKNAHGVIVVEDATLFINENVAKLKKAVDRFNICDGKKIPCVLAVNKIDLLPKEEDQFKVFQLMVFARENGFDGVFRTSVKENININETFDFLLKEIITRLDKYGEENPDWLELAMNSRKRNFKVEEEKKEEAQRESKSEGYLPITKEEVKQLEALDFEFLNNKSTSAKSAEESSTEEDLIYRDLSMGESLNIFISNLNRVRVVVIGEAETGKTSYITRLASNSFYDACSHTEKFNSKTKQINCEGYSYEIEMCDIPNIHSNPLITKMYIDDIKGAVVICDGKSLDNALRWKSIVDDKIPCVLVENKIDLLPKEEQINDKRLKEFAIANGFDAAFKVSVKEDVNVNESMNFLIHKIHLIQYK